MDENAEMRLGGRPLTELALLFLRLGITAFGGPAAHIAMMQDEVVERRKWLTSEEFLDLLGAANLIPGPNSTELAIHIGHRRAGLKGLLVAGVCFIVPAALLTFALAWVYVRFRSVPQAQGIFYGVKPVIIAVVVQAIVSLGKSALKTKPSLALGTACALGAFFGLNELAILFGAGATTMALRGLRRRPPAVGMLQAAPLAVGATGQLAIAFSPARLFLVFVKIGAVLYGSGYVLLAFLRNDLVERLHWLTEKQLMDAIAVGQMTPGPVFSTATFIGYLVGGGKGAFLATAGIFLPSFVFVALSGSLIPRIRRSGSARAFLDGVNVASLALMAVVCVQLGRAALVDAITIGMAAVSGLLFARFKVNSAWLVLAGATIGFALEHGPT